MSGTGKSSALAELAQRGFRVVDTDSTQWSEWNGEEWLWREDRIAELLAQDGDRTLFVSGCMSNQGKFYDRFDAVVLLSAPAEVILERVDRRTTNDYGKSARERDARARREPAARRGRRRPGRDRQPTSALNAGSSRIGSKSESRAASERDRPESSIASRRCSIASSLRPARLSQHARL
jgi:hypothetical protein